MPADSSTVTAAEDQALFTDPVARALLDARRDQAERLLNRVRIAVLLLLGLGGGGLGIDVACIERQIVLRQVGLRTALWLGGSLGVNLGGRRPALGRIVNHGP